VESGIEALSYRALGAAGVILSTTGSAIERPATMARLLMARGYEIVTAFNADKSGDRMAERMRELLGSEVRRDRPSSGKDWNEQLKSLRTDQEAGPGRRLDAHRSGEGESVDCRQAALNRG
jgi:hypothetical protein